ncbi:MAG: FprA family A-type flavoprotein, partial [Rikenellaceae bacterium]
MDDHELDLFESQYSVPDGMSYNSYLILDEKIAILDTVDISKIEQWVENLQRELAGRTPDYIIVTHMEPDHAAGLVRALELYPSMQIVGNAKTFGMIPQFFSLDISERQVVVKEGDTLELGEHFLKFMMAPMVHWPEVMVVYDSFDQTLYSADAFGKFGALDAPDPEGWTCEARRYYYNIVGKYGTNVQSLLKKLDGTPISTI